MGLLILGFDGMEYDLVKRWKLRSLQQSQYGRLTIPRECFKETKDPLGNIVFEPWTPFVWSSILTGKLPQEVGLSEESIKEWQNPILQFARKLSVKLELNKRRLTRRLFEGRGSALEDLGLRKKRFNLAETAKATTIFDKAQQPIAINVPLFQMAQSPYGEEKWELELHGKTVSGMIKEAWTDFHRIKLRTLKAIATKNWDLLMSNVRFLDTIGELQYGRFLKMHKAYMTCNNYARIAKQLAGKEEPCLMLSDHGMKLMEGTRFGMHSNHAFYSFNRRLEPQPQSITDLYQRILELIEDGFRGVRAKA